MIRSVLLMLLGLFPSLLLQAADAPSPGGAAPAAGAAANSAAQARNAYRVEVIIFRQAQAPAGSEDFSAQPENRGFGDRRDVSDAPPTVLRQLDDADLQMNAVAQRMRAGGMQVLAHKGWIQTATTWGRHAGLPLDAFGISAPDLRGTLYLERGDLLHFGAYLQLGSGPVYTISELRRLRFNERNFIDHPAFGVVVMVSPSRS